MSIVTALFGSKKDKDIKALEPIVKLVNEQEDWAKSLKDEDFPKQTVQFRKELSEGASSDSILPKAFALAREASFRVLGERHYDVQIMGAVVLHQGKILEMKTGEGKTLTCVPAAYLNALEGKGVHVVTVNDYLAQRDSQWMGRVYKFLGLTVGCVLSQMDNARKKEAYNCDITYGTNNELGFDYLRDNMQLSLSGKVQRGHHYCIVDEIDSILIDEARTPLIISGPSSEDENLPRNAQRTVQFFKECEKDPETGTYPVISAMARFDATAKKEPDGDYMLDEKSRRVTFTAQGMVHMEEILKRLNIISGSLYDDSNFEYVHYITQAMVANHLYHKDVDYVVQDNQVQIVDTFTGRILYGRRYSDGLHQAIEVKENIKIQGRFVTQATITFQNFFRMYDKLSGMTGTADTEAQEFNEIYNLDVVVIPTNKPVIRKDMLDSVYLNEQFKLEAVCKEIEKVHKTGQPLLVGTASVEKSELLSAMLRKRGVPHEVLNAKNHAREASIIENAGAVGAVTIATNMAGRGTDIKLGGSPEYFARKICSSEASPEELAVALEKTHDQWLEQYNKVKELGGLYVIGTERHESRRIDNQLRGRSGRQGDPGVSRFYVCFDDTVLRLFAPDSAKALLSRVGLSSEPLEMSILTKSIETAQKRVEERNFEIRKHLLDYDDLLNEQRNFIYKQRDEILSQENLIPRILEANYEFAQEAAEVAFDKSNNLSKTEALVQDFREKTGFELPASLNFDEMTQAEAVEKVKEAVKASIDEKVRIVPAPILSMFIQQTYLKNIDNNWVEHLEELEALRDAVGLRSYAQRDPLLEYKIEGSEIFDHMIDTIKTAVLKTVNRVQISLTPSAYTARQRQFTAQHKDFGISNLAQQQAARVRNAAQNIGQTSSVQVVRTAPKVGRNDPCPCGSGKKYKNCCGKNVSSN